MAEQVGKLFQASKMSHAIAWNTNNACLQKGAKQHAAMPWGLKVIRKSGYASNFPLNIRALCQNLIMHAHTIADAYFWSFCDNGLPTSWQHRHPIHACKAIYPIAKF
jgi:hypothetical protein